MGRGAQEVLHGERLVWLTERGLPPGSVSVSRGRGGMRSRSSIPTAETTSSTEQPPKSQTSVRPSPASLIESLVLFRPPARWAPRTPLLIADTMDAVKATE